MPWPGVERDAPARCDLKPMNAVPLVGVHDADGILKRKKPPEGGFCFRTEEQLIGDGE